MQPQLEQNCEIDFKVKNLKVLHGSDISVLDAERIRVDQDSWKQKKLSFLKYLFINPIKKHQLFLVGGDALAGLAGILAFCGPSRVFNSWIGLAGLIGSILFAILTFYILRFYEDLEFNRKICRRILALGVFPLGLLAFFWAGWGNPWEELTRFLFAGSLTLGMMIGFRYLSTLAVKPGKKLAFLGEHPLMEAILGEIKKLPVKPYQVVVNGQDGRTPAFQSPDHLLRSLNGDKLHMLLVSGAETGRRAKSILTRNGHHDLIIYDSREFYELLTGKVFLPLEGAESRIQEQAFPLWKRVFDVGLSAFFGLVSVLPVLIISLLIRLSSKGPVLFRQEKVGFRGKTFGLCKFRSMVEGAEVLNGLHAVTEKDDSRITTIGKFLRLSHLDELPQFLSILKGEMSFIGSRPLNKHLEKHLSEKFRHHSLRYLTVPGLTGWAQINHPDSRSAEGQKERLQYDLFYIRHRSLLMDAFIFLKSLKIVMTGFGAR